MVTDWDSITAAIARAQGGDREHGLRELVACWEGTAHNEHAARRVIAHYLARLQPALPEEIARDERCSRLRAESAPQARGYLRQGRIADARDQLAAGLAAQDELDDDGYDGARFSGGMTTVILSKTPDPRLVTIRRGGTLTDADHHLLALWAASCAEHVLDLFEAAQPDDPRPREAIEHARAWVRGEVAMMTARAAGGHAMGAARALRGPARYAAYAAGQAACVAHVAAHDLGAAAYAIQAARAAAPDRAQDAARRHECRWQRAQLPEAVRALVLDDQRLRNDICWSVFT